MKAQNRWQNQKWQKNKDSDNSWINYSQQKIESWWMFSQLNEERCSIVCSEIVVQVFSLQKRMMLIKEIVFVLILKQSTKIYYRWFY